MSATPWRRRPTMISASPLDTARRATSSCPGSPLAPVSGIGTGTGRRRSRSGFSRGSRRLLAASAAVVVGACSGSRRGRRLGFSSRSRRRRRDLRTWRSLWQRDGERRFRRAHPRPTSRKFYRRWRSLRARVKGTPTGEAGRGGVRPLPRVPVEDGGGDDHVGLGRGVVRPWRLDRIDETRRRLELHRRRQ